MKILTLKHPARCQECGDDIPVGQRAQVLSASPWTFQHYHRCPIDEDDHPTTSITPTSFSGAPNKQPNTNTAARTAQRRQRRWGKRDA